MAGKEVTKLDLDNRMASSLVSLRRTVIELENINEFLATIPIITNADGTTTEPLSLSTVPTDPMDPSTAPGKYGYTNEEAALIRDVFGSLQALRANLEPVLKKARKLTGLE